VSGPGATAAPPTLGEIEAFLFREADLMDEGRYQEWEALWDDDAVYWVPVKAEDYDPARHISIIYEDRQAIHVRVERLAAGLAYTQEPRSQVRRVISNITVLRADREAVEVSSNFVALEYRMGRWMQWAGRSEHTLTPQAEGGFKISRKKVLLVGLDSDLPALQFLV
jgi:benzoate/toluate 1,2-dioxygenase subunit beta